MARNVAIQFARGNAVSIPTLADGEFYVAIDTGQLFVGLGGVNYTLGAAFMATVQVQGSANPTHFVEPATDGSLVASLGTAAGKTAVLKTGQLTTVAITANQIVLTYTVTAAKTLYLQYIDFAGRLTVPSATASVLGAVIVQIGGVTVYTGSIVNPTTSDCGSQTVRLMFTEPIPIAAATAVAVLVTPAAATSMLWTANFGGYEK